jgi:predicted DNA-binding transcriptional regulator AlpA
MRECRLSAPRPRFISTEFRPSSAAAGASWKATPALSIKRTFRSQLSGNSGARRSRVVQLESLVSLSKNSFDDFLGCFHAPKRSHIGPFFGWLSAELPLYRSIRAPRISRHAYISADDSVRPYNRTGADRPSACRRAAKRNLGRSRSRNLRLLRASPERRTNKNAVSRRRRRFI